MFASNTSQVANDAVFIEDTFSCTLYTGNGSTQTITNGIDLAGKGGLVWTKTRSSTGNHLLRDTARGTNYGLYSNLTNSQINGGSAYSLSLGTSSYSMTSDDGDTNVTGITYASWTFRKQPKFFDVVTYTGDGNSGRTIPHLLGSTPGFMIIKSTTLNNNWIVYHRSLGYQNWMILNGTLSALADDTQWVANPTSTVFTVGSGSLNNTSGQSYVAYLFAHNAGGFGLTGTDNVISCGSLVSTGGVVNVNLGYETQWLLIKNASNIDSWYMYDTMRGMSMTDDYFLKANSTNAESNFGASYVKPTATGFSFDSSAFGASGETYIYIAIRRGPMKVPTSGTSVFEPEAYTGTSATRTITSGFPVDLSISKIRSQNYPGGWFDRLRGALQVVRSSSTDPEATSPDSLTGFDSNTGVVLGSDGSGRINTSPDTYAMWNFRRAPSTFDEVCYTGTGSTTAYNHNLGVAPELMIIKSRNDANDWAVYSSALGNTKNLRLNTTAAASTALNLWASTTPSATTFTTNGTYNLVGGGTITYVAYLFATCAGVSKCGTFTGTGTTQQVDCGFAAGARFVLIKRTDSTGDWYVWDSARGIVSGNDPYLLLNSTAAEVTITDYIDTYSAGFELSTTAAATVNVLNGTYIYLAIA